jgi:hypothetical protein
VTKLRDFNPMKRNSYEGDSRVIDSKLDEPNEKFLKRMEIPIKKRKKYNWAVLTNKKQL